MHPKGLRWQAAGRGCSGGIEFRGVAHAAAVFRQGVEDVEAVDEAGEDLAGIGADT